MNETKIVMLLVAAKDEVGYLEKRSNACLDSKKENSGYRNYTKYARDLDALKFYNTPKQGFAWCAVFVDWCFVKAFGMENALLATYQPKGGYGAGCAESMRYYQANHAFSHAPHKGDQIFFQRNGVIVHTGLVMNIIDDNVVTVEGNTSNTDGLDDSGGGVFYKSYKVTDKCIAGYGHPAFSKIKMEVEEDMDGLQIYQKLQEYFEGEPAPEWIREEFNEAVEMGITDGTRPCVLVPAWRAAVMAKRAVEKALKEVANGERPSDLPTQGEPSQDD